MKKFNLLYCFDEGYNLQTYASIYSIAKNLTKSKLDIYSINVYQEDGKLIKNTNEKNFYLEGNKIYFLKIFTDSGNIVKTVFVK